MFDIYTQLAADAFEKPLADVTPVERKFCKDLAFCQLYGGTRPNVTDASRYIAAFKKRFPKIRANLNLA